MTRRIVVTLTEAQYNALAGAVALQTTEFEAGDSGTSKDLAVLDRAWEKIFRAWHGGRA